MSGSLGVEIAARPYSQDWSLYGLFSVGGLWPGFRLHFYGFGNYRRGEGG
tara:strand:- start:268 stop:417 length:150 start_codon:yes stop_codon:yes gene_type:complete